MVLSAAEARPLPPQVSVFGAAGLAILIWAATPLATKVAVGEVPPDMVGMLRTLIAGLVALPILLWRGLLWRGLARLDRAAAGLLAVAALGGFVVFPLLFSAGTRLTTASQAALILAAQPVFTGLIASAWDRMRPRPGWIGGILIALVGEAVLIWPDGGLGFAGSGAVFAGNVMVLGAGLAACFGYVAGAKLSGRMRSLDVILSAVFIASLLLLPWFAWRAGAVDWSAAGTGAWAGVLHLALMTTIVGYVLWNWALGAGGAGRIGTLQFGQPLLGAALAVLLLAEPVTAAMVAGAVLIIGGVFIAVRRG